MAIQTRVPLPADLVKAVDEAVGARERGRFIEEAIRRHLRREETTAILRETAGALRGSYPDWETPEAVSAWVSERRSEDEALRDAHRASHEE